MKAILVIDEIPKNCQDCDYDRYVEDFKHRYCVANPRNVKCLDEERDGDYYLERKKWCPLKPLQLPNAKEQVPLVIKNENDSLKEVYEYGVIDGYNECVREVLGWNESNISN